jgi:hypothetical protein
MSRHDQTAWTISRQQTGLTDLPLTAQAELEAVRLGRRLEKLTFAGVLTSPLRRAVRTCELAGFGPAAVVEPDLAEWNYGAYEGGADRHGAPGQIVVPARLAALRLRDGGRGERTRACAFLRKPTFGVSPMTAGAS